MKKSRLKRDFIFYWKFEIPQFSNLFDCRQILFRIQSRHTACSGSSDCLAVNMICCVAANENAGNIGE